ncbi:UNVERIFIED_CONTAM: hypothetical protein PYX00_005598 [Menopon gallinae]|uniref:Uncharacterized protein n=1 Tax=Menopon gallinae TaxID=328185 RepID=A0AAW2HTG6_9NEOP
MRDNSRDSSFITYASSSSSNSTVQSAQEDLCDEPEIYKKLINHYQITPEQNLSDLTIIADSCRRQLTTSFHV